MADPRLPASLADELASLKRRLAALERQAANGIGTNTMTGTLSVEDDTGVERVRLGSLGGGRSGIIAGNNPSGGGSDTFFMVSELGLEVPYIPLAVSKPNDYVSVTSGSFLAVWEWPIGIVTTKGIQATFVVSADAGTTGEVRMGSGYLSAYTSVISIPAGSADTYLYHWELPAPYVLGAGPYFMSLEVRRTGGGGSIHAYRPYVTIGRTTFETPTGL